ncbi:MAG: CHRD domain-containing protein [Planctomycetota bacterium]|nr:CHRD domain-containing protein [Planctomycetota bacterium]
MKRAHAAGLVALSAFFTTGLERPAQAQLVTFTATLNGLQEVPPTETPAIGTAVLELDLTSRAWTLDIRFSSLTTPVVSAHIHRAPPGVNGPVIVPLDGTNGGWSLILPGVFSFDTGSPVASPLPFPADEVDDLLAGNTYVNIHSERFPGGEIRGQLIPGSGTLALAGVALAWGVRRRRVN